jgi:hypothetical protein
VTNLVGVAPGHRFDRARITEPQERAGARGALGRLGARAAAAAVGQAAPDRDAPEPTQSVILTVTSEVRNVSTRTLDPSLFEVPGDYREARP